MCEQQKLRRVYANAQVIRALAPHIQNMTIHLEAGRCFDCMYEQRMRLVRRFAISTFSRHWPFFY